ncbi:MAG: GerAB/ArcD/ProY family transporter [Bacillota bacterium]|jgi:spore germination protein KB
MLESGKITPGQAGFLMGLTVLGTANLVMPSLTARFAGADTWMAVALATFPHILLILVIDRIGKSFPQQSIVTYIRKITGKYLGILIILGYIWYLIFITAMITRTVAEFLLTTFMPDTPIEVFIIVILLLGAWAVKAGLEVLARAATFITPIFLISFAIILLLLVGEMDFSFLKPFLENGFKPVLHATLYPSIWRGQFVLMLFIWPYLNKPEQGLRSMLQVAVVIVLLLLSLTIASTSIFGPLVVTLRFPTFALVEYIDLAGFITRLDAVFMAVWIAGVFIKIGVFYYCLCLILSELLGLMDYRCTVYPLGIIIGALVIIVAPNMVVFDNLFPKVVLPLTLLFEYFLPCGLLGLIFLRGLHKKKGGKTNGV